MTLQTPIRIGTRDSELALWQAKTVADKLEKLGHQTQIVPVKSQGDLVLDKPLYEFGITGIFTKSLDIALLQKEIDIAVHSMKDVPTQLPKGMSQYAVLERGEVHDLLVYNADRFDPFETQTPTPKATIATGSLRRKAQWLAMYPHHEVVDLRGNVNKRLEKLETNSWEGAIFAAAGLERLEKNLIHTEDLDWMIPAPAQGAIMIAGLEENTTLSEIIQPLNDELTAFCVQEERDFLRTLEGGCTAPIGAYAFVIGSNFYFQGGLFSLDGKEKVVVEKTIPLLEASGFGTQSAKWVLENQGKQIMQQIKEQLNK